MNSPYTQEDMDIIDIYTRAQAIEDGVLIDISPWAEEAGFKYPVAVTAGIWAILEPSDELKKFGQDVHGRAWDLFTILHHAIKKASRTDRVHFAPLFVLDPENPKPQPVQMWAACGPGDQSEPVITIMLEGED